MPSPPAGSGEARQEERRRGETAAEWRLRDSNYVEIPINDAKSPLVRRRLPRKYSKPVLRRPDESYDVFYIAFSIVSIAVASDPAAKKRTFFDNRLPVYVHLYIYENKSLKILYKKYNIRMTAFKDREEV